ncbi:YD repeat protein [Candidatus Vecturithrix granuli]|uniref:YD repeat protein n=1 Tax=Vecturithrix granuli TaxID=1499967 RepID=A0A081BXF8_VECG1|nr:YD repeat protein [Candidatus Vecturithrix granuli]
MAQQQDGVFTWIHSDHLHSATVLTDADGLDIRRLAYAAFGEEAANSGPGAAPTYTYTDKERDSSGLLYYGARYYDPALARFITADSVYDAGPQGLNRYSYALNNPILYRDPTGQFINGPDDENDPLSYGAVTGSQEQFQDGTALIHDGRDGTADQTIRTYLAGGYAAFPPAPSISHLPMSWNVDCRMRGPFGPHGGIIDRFMYSGWAAGFANQWERSARESRDILYGLVERYPCAETIALATMITTSIDFGSGLVDTLRLGEGMAEGGWGYGKDVLRATVIVSHSFKVLRGIGVRGEFGSGRFYQWNEFLDWASENKGYLNSAMTPGWNNTFKLIQGLPKPLKQVGMIGFKTANLAHYARATKLYVYGDALSGFGKWERWIVNFVGGIIEHIPGK